MYEQAIGAPTSTSAALGNCDVVHRAFVAAQSTCLALAFNAESHCEIQVVERKQKKEREGLFYDVLFFFVS